MNLLLFASAVLANGQGTFRNLDFEAASQYITPTQPGQYGGTVDPALAFQGWTVGNAPGSMPTFYLYNNVTVGSPAVDLIGPDFPNGLGLNPLHGLYSVVIQNWGSGPGPTLSQTALVPADARSLSLMVDPRYSGVAVSLNGVNIPLVSFNGGALLAGDVSRLAGQTAQLTFTATAHGQAYFDFIQFSTASVPEPSFSAMAGFGAAMVLWRRCLTNR